MVLVVKKTKAKQNGQNKTEQNRTEQNKTKQNKTKQNRTENRRQRLLLIHEKKGKVHVVRINRPEGPYTIRQRHGVNFSLF